MKQKQKTNKELQNDMVCALGMCKYALSLMEEPQNNMFKFLDYMNICKDLNRLSLDKVNTMFAKTEENEHERITILKAKILLDKNVILYIQMDEPTTKVKAFVQYAQRASTNTEKALYKLNQINQLWQEKQTLCEF